MNVLLVDDDPSIRGLMTIILETAGCEVAQACHGKAALDALGVSPMPSLVVTDLMMPVMSGMELIRRLRSEPRTAQLPIVVVSANADCDEGYEVADLADAMLDKASIVKDLIPTIRSIEAGRPPYLVTSA